MPYKLRLAALATSAALCACAAGCGGSSQTASNPQLVAQADAICKTVAAKRSAANAKLHSTATSTSKSLKTLAQVAPVMALEERRAIDRLAALQTPISSASEWRLMITGLRLLANNASQLALDAKANSIGRVQKTDAEGRQVRQRLDAIAARNGFTYCGRAS